MNAAALFATRCPACGSEGARRRLNPGIALGYGAMGAYLVWIDFEVSWYGGVGVMHGVLGGILLVLSSWGLVSDARALLSSRRGSGFWIETRTTCRGCGVRSRYLPSHRIVRTLVLATLGLLAWLRFGRTWL